MSHKPRTVLLTNYAKIALFLGAALATGQQGLIALGWLAN